MNTFPCLCLKNGNPVVPIGVCVFHDREDEVALWSPDGTSRCAQADGEDEGQDGCRCGAEDEASAGMEDKKILQMNKARSSVLGESPPWCLTVIKKRLYLFGYIQYLWNLPAPTQR